MADLMLWFTRCLLITTRNLIVTAKVFHFRADMGGTCYQGAIAATYDSTPRCGICFIYFHNSINHLELNHLELNTCQWNGNCTYNL